LLPLPALQLAQPLQVCVPLTRLHASCRCSLNCSHTVRNLSPHLDA
jgi:hypothetical protein